MSRDEATDLLVLMGVDAGAMRSYHMWQLMEKSLSAQKKTMLDVLIGLLSSVLTVINFMSAMQIPESLWIVLPVSVVIMVIAIVLWLRGRGQSYAVLGAVRKFGLYLDSMRRHYRQLQIAEHLSETGVDLDAIKDSILRGLEVAIEGIDALKEDMTKIDYYTLGEIQEKVKGEIEKARTRVSQTPSSTSQ